MLPPIYMPWPLYALVEKENIIKPLNNRTANFFQ